MNARDQSASSEPSKFGTFGGVFTPCTLTILGVIMFLRYGQVVGNSGVIGAIIILLIAKSITTLTTLSLSAVATNTRVKGGGAYFLISRSLGPEFGGAIGAVFFLAQAVSVAMYIIGFTEALLATFPDLGWSSQIVASIVNVAVFVCVYIGAGWTIKVQYVILGALILSLISFFVGATQIGSVENLQENLAPSYSESATFVTMLALFFPAVTGIMAGANMSGDLANPGKSIPRGTLGAIVVTGLVYLGMAVLLGAAATREQLLADNMIVRAVSWSGVLITLGVFAATLSSALGSMMGAPRVLQALAKDNLFASLRRFGHGSGKSNEPRRATIATFVIAQAGIMIGDLNAIAPIITMFFMITYGSINFATFYESITRNPSYRPTFRWSHWSTALLGSLGCVVMMVMISWVWALVSIAGMALLHWYVTRKQIEATWGDATSGAAFERARKNLLQLETDRFHPKNWRPSILALSGGAWSRIHLAIFGHWLTGGRGLLSLAQVIEGDNEVHFMRRVNQERAMRSFILEHEIDAFPVVLVTPKYGAGVEVLLQCYGVGAFRPNMILMGWSDDPARAADFCNTLRLSQELERSIVVVHTDRDIEDQWSPPPGTIDVWWRGRENGALMLLLAHLMTQNISWRGRTIRFMRMIGSESGREDAQKHLESLVEHARIRASAFVFVGDDFKSVLTRISGNAAVVFLGLDLPDEGADEDFIARVKSSIETIPTSILIHSDGKATLEA